MARRGSNSEALALALGWWFLKRRLRKRTAQLSGLVAEERRKRSPLRWLLGLGLVAAAAGGVIWWRGRQGGGGDDWGDWEPVAPITPEPAQPAPSPEPEPVAT
jgi:hypothetical protein